ncbi:hypothetical protein BH11BAC2_BH11BAC2_21720 [soil metagenome]
MLKSFLETDFYLLEKWVQTPEILFEFAGTTFTFPLTYLQIVNYQLQFPDRLLYLGYTPEGRAFAFGEIIPQCTNIPRLGRILVGEQSDRGKGLGKYFIKLLISECTRRFLTAKVELYVMEENKIAQQTYKSLGFEFSTDDPILLHHQEKVYKIFKMKRST